MPIKMGNLEDLDAISFNGTSLDSVVFNGTEVWSGNKSFPAGSTFSAAGGMYQGTDKDGWHARFYKNGTFSLSKRRTVDIFVVGGGGAGGFNKGGGGGGGYRQTYSNITLNPGNYSVVIGAGGSMVRDGNAYGGNGGTSSFGTYTAAGGHGGQGGYLVANPAGGVGGARGGNGISGGKGGDGSYPFGSSAFGAACGGGGGGGFSPDFRWNNNASYGGGYGGGLSDFDSHVAKAGTANTGGGGGGGGDVVYFSVLGGEIGSFDGANGGSGLVVIRNHRG